MEEMLDLVNEQGAPIGRAVPRSEAHRLGLRHRTSHVCLLWLDRDAEEFTLQKEEISAVRWMPLADCLRNVENGALNSCIFPEELRMVQATVEKASAT